MSEPISESALANLLGVNKDVIGRQRDALPAELQPFVKKKGAAVFYADEAVRAIEAALAPIPEPEKKDGPRPVETLFVVRAARMNRSMVFAREKKDGAPEVAVLVKNAALFVPGQEVRVHFDDASRTRARLFGPQPRGRGRNATRQPLPT